MKAINSTITFKGYKVDRLTFEPKTPAATNEADERPSFVPVFTREITGYDSGDCKINLTSTVGQSDDTMPFTAHVSITGDFYVPDPENAQEIMKINGTAILFPYLRAVVTQLTAAANLKPVFLPTVNLVEMFNEQKNKNIVEQKIDK